MCEGNYVETIFFVGNSTAELCRPIPPEGKEYGQDGSGPYFISNPVCEVSCIANKNGAGNQVGCSLIYTSLENVEYFKPVDSKRFSSSTDQFEMSGFCSNTSASGILRTSSPSCTCSR
ncbi:hypothetical protein [Halobacteriovorax sp. ZH4_bin.1]|uniref:hypothetical protein n=1 Tax=unclassified Halobacteriovorax TaxID=2639665 RepID=UPI0037184AE1